MMNLPFNSDVDGWADRDEPTPVDPDLYWREQCILYLLDELDEQATDAFVQQLERSNPLNQYLSEQAQSISTLAADRVGSSEPVQTPTSQPHWSGMLAAVIALAAAVLVVIGLQRRGNESLEQETIALAWVDSQSVAVTVAAPEANDDLLDEIELTLVAAQTDSQIDETLDWMYTALSMEVGTSLGESNDG